MTIRDMISAYVLADNSISALIGVRLFPEWPQKVAYPAGKLFRVDTVRPPALNNIASFAMARLQFDFDCDGNGAALLHMSGSQAVVDRIGDLLRARLDGFGWTHGSGYLSDTSTSPATSVRVWVFIEPETNGTKPEINGGLSSFSVDYMVKYQTHGGIY